MKFDLKTVCLVLSLILNALGGTGVVHPIVGGTPAPAPAPAPSH